MNLVPLVSVLLLELFTTARCLKANYIIMMHHLTPNKANAIHNITHGSVPSQYRQPWPYSVLVVELL